jgi:predicted phosphodiesterase
VLGAPRKWVSSITSTERKPVRFGIVADIHANLEAFTVALETMEKEGVDQIICLGDIIGYNANPRECLAIIIDRKIPSIRGNHERFAIGEAEEPLKEDTLKMSEWTRRQLSDEQMQFLETMPNKMEHEVGFLITHGSPRNKDEYLLKLHAFIANLKLMEEKYPHLKICFHGHTHLPSVMAGGHIVQEIQKDTVVTLDANKIYLINPGSVGQPRDHCPLTSFGIFDHTAYTFNFYRRPYDIESAQKKIQALGFVPRFADRLATGT